MAARILVVEDEQDLNRNLVYNLEREGYSVVAALTGSAGLALAHEEPIPDLVLLDLMLPDLSGTEICRRLREDPLTREMLVVMVTARDDEIDRVVGFEVGADDYVVKPFSVRELMLRVRALLRRRTTDKATVDRIRFGDLWVEREAHRVWVNEDEITLTALEFKLLLTLLDRRGRVQDRTRLLDDVWGITADINTRTVDTHVKRLRKKLRVAGRYIETLRGVGYRFTDREA